MQSSQRLGPIWLTTGITRRNALTYLYASFFTIGIVSFMSFMQPYVLAENLNIPRHQQGGATGMLSFSYELIMLMLVAPMGALADKIGRRPIYVVGFLWIGAALAIFPLAQNLTQLIMGRMFFAVGAAAITAMMATVLADYPQERSRGLLVAASGIANGLGAMTLVIILSQLPALFAGRGYSTLTAGRMTFWVVTGLCIVTAAIVARGLQAGKPGEQQQQPLAELIHEALQAARQNPRIMVACLTAFVARGDLVVISTFFALWANQAGQMQGLALEEAIRKAATFIIIIQGSSLFWAPVWGFVLDRWDRLSAVCLALLIASIAYFWVGFSPSPIVAAFIPAAILLGVGEFSAIMSGAALIGQSAPVDIRGSILGLFNFCGSIGILCIVFIGGVVFDAWMPGAPFVVVGVLNFAVCLTAIWVRRRVGYERPHTEAR
ncbi:MAG: MFS transporter [Gammaproteobacteria bacterium]|jgi:MFS family permease|nr:MFS transporter [Gammaproteobacteria bacterium]MDP7659858.1 MFS transporter [Gammaproteobacteria bacterium]